MWIGTKSRSGHSYASLTALSEKKEIKSDEVHKATRGIIEIEELLETGLMKRGRAGRGRTYEVKTPAERFTSLLEKFKDESAVSQTLPFDESSAATEEGKFLFIDRLHFLIALAEGKENLKPWIERWRGEIPQIRAACEYLLERRKDFTPALKKILTMIDVGRPARGFLDRCEARDLDSPLDFLLKQLAYQFPLQNAGGELSNSRTQLLPHQILLTHSLVNATRRRFLIADEVGLGKTIEAGMTVRELIARLQADRILIICPAGLTKNWQSELSDCFRLDFEILGRDFIDDRPAIWERHGRVIASIDRLKKGPRMDRLLAGPKWDMVLFDDRPELCFLQHPLREGSVGRRIPIPAKKAGSLTFGARITLTST